MLTYLFRTQADSNGSTLEEHGFASRYSDLKLFLYNFEHKGEKKFIHMQVNSKQCLPRDLSNTRIENLPPYYQNPIFLCPNSIQLNVYTSSEALNSELNINLLEDSCTNIERIYLNMYPGGSVCEVIKYLNN